ncbi:MAG: hypothetical protein WCK31_04695, partial [bacterium]
YGGKGVERFLKSDKEGLSKYLTSNNVHPGSHILQKYYDVKMGIPRVVSGIHDMRIMITNNRIIFCYIRKPSNPNEFRANFAVGGTMEEVIVSNIPTEIVSFVNPIMKEAYEKYKNPLFAIDLFMTEEGPKIIEITGANMGFPMPDMNLQPFYSHLVERFTK